MTQWTAVVVKGALSTTLTWSLNGTLPSTTEPEPGEVSAWVINFESQASLSLTLLPLHDTPTRWIDIRSDTRPYRCGSTLLRALNI